jgi:transcriptional regulator with XRE-family HTH domain
MAEPLSDASRVLGERLRDQRLKLGLSQEDIAHLAGLNVSNFGKIERGAEQPDAAHARARRIRSRHRSRRARVGLERDRSP